MTDMTLHPLHGLLMDFFEVFPQTNVVVTQDSSTRRMEGKQTERQQSITRKIRDGVSKI